MAKIEKSKIIFFSYCLVQILYWAGGSIAVGFSTAFLLELGFSNAAVGVISSCASVLGFVLMFSVSAMIDLRGGKTMRNWIIVTTVIQSVLISVIYIYRRPNLFTLVFYLLYIASAHLLGSLVTKLYIDLNEGGNQINYGVARGLGSLSYALTSFAAGWIKAANPSAFLQFGAQGCFLIVLLLSLKLCSYTGISRLRGGNRQRKAVNLIFISALVRADRLFLILTLGAALVYSCNLTLTVFLVDVVDNLGGNMRDFGTLTGYLALLEVPVIILYSRLRRHFSAAGLLLTSIVFFTLKIGAYAIIRTMPLLILASTIQSLSVGLYQPASVDFVIEILPFERTATGQSLMSGLPFLMTFITTTIFGFLLDAFSLQFCLLLLLCVSVAGTLICSFTIKTMKAV